MRHSQGRMCKADEQRASAVRTEGHATLSLRLPLCTETRGAVEEEAERTKPGEDWRHEEPPHAEMYGTG